MCGVSACDREGLEIEEALATKECHTMKEKLLITYKKWGLRSPVQSDKDIFDYDGRYQNICLTAVTTTL
jgi:hypothetical protein